MSTETHSAKAKVACDGPREAPVTPEQSNAQNSSGAKDTETLFWEAFERAGNETLEEHYERFPFLSESRQSQFAFAGRFLSADCMGFGVPENITPGTGVDIDKGMQIMKELERQEAAIPDETETTGASNAS